MGSSHHPQGGMASHRLADGLDPRRVMDPRSRAILDLEPIHDAHLLRLSSQHASRRVQHIITGNKSAPLSKPHPPSILQEPAINSTHLLQHKIQLVRQTKFDPVDAMAQYMSNKESLKAVQDRVTAKVIINLFGSAAPSGTNFGNDFLSNAKLQSLNAPRTAVERYSDLPSLIDSFQHKHGGLVTHQSAASLQKHASSIPRPRTLPRAKKSTSQAWIESLECRPDLEEL